MFAVFETERDTIALQKQHLAFWQFVFDVPAPSTSKNEAGESTAEETAVPLTIWFERSTTPKVLSMDPDDEEFGVDEPEETTQLQCLFYDLDHCFEPDDCFHVRDEDGEVAFIRAGN